MNHPAAIEQNGLHVRLQAPESTTWDPQAPWLDPGIALKSTLFFPPLQSPRFNPGLEHHL